ncbi:hypothetical protein TNCT1_20290 [Streptomyces sp. 1-11]|nr:hypothetical protein TNCT1_20290 [Streptomyces sp. 1-11]
MLAEKAGWQIVGTDAIVVKAFNTTFAGLLSPGEGHGFPLDVLIAGDDSAAKDKVADLISSGAMRPLDVGPLRRARQLEALGFLHIKDHRQEQKFTTITPPAGAVITGMRWHRLLSASECLDEPFVVASMPTGVHDPGSGSVRRPNAGAE